MLMLMLLWVRTADAERVRMCDVQLDREVDAQYVIIIIIIIMLVAFPALNLKT